MAPKQGLQSQWMAASEQPTQQSGSCHRPPRRAEGWRACGRASATCLSYLDRAAKIAIKIFAHSNSIYHNNFASAIGSICADAHNRSGGRSRIKSISFANSPIAMTAETQKTRSNVYRPAWCESRPDFADTLGTLSSEKGNLSITAASPTKFLHRRFRYVNQLKTKIQCHGSWTLVAFFLPLQIKGKLDSSSFEDTVASHSVFSRFSQGSLGTH